MNATAKKVIVALALAAVAAGGYVSWDRLHGQGAAAAFASGNGRIEATEIAVASKLAGRLANVLVSEGEFVRAGQVLAQMDVASLQAQRAQAVAQLEQARATVVGAEAQVALRLSDAQAARALVVQRESDVTNAQRHLSRSEALAQQGMATGQWLDDDQARVRSAQAALIATRAQVGSATAAVAAARTQVQAARASVVAAQAAVDRVDVELQDSRLTAPRDARVQYLVARPGEVVAAGARVLSLVDLSDVYMSFFLPEAQAGQVGLGTEVRIVLDAAPRYMIPARVSYVASVAQFTPKTVETATERQKLMFRIKAQIDRELLQRHLQQVKTGLPGVAWVRLDAQASWPAALAGKELP